VQSLLLKSEPRGPERGSACPSSPCELLYGLDWILASSVSLYSSTQPASSVSVSEGSVACLSLTCPLSSFTVAGAIHHSDDLAGTNQKAIVHL
jgi:hypothetical protein